MKILSYIAAAILLAGCGGTRSAQVTPLPLPTAELALTEGCRIGLVPFQIAKTAVSGGHHEGLLQVRQPWQWGPTPEQNTAMRGDLLKVVDHAIGDELKRNRLEVVPLTTQIFTDAEEWKKAEASCDYILSGTVSDVTYNTYGRGAEGFGSAGDYREAYVTIEGAALHDCRQHKGVWSGGSKGYAKLPGSPVILDWTFKDVIEKSKLMGAKDAGLQERLDASKATYTIEPEQVSVVDLAARLALQDLLKTALPREIPQPSPEK